MDSTNYRMNKNRKKSDNFVDGVREHGKLVTVCILLQLRLRVILILTILFVKLQ